MSAWQFAVFITCYSEAEAHTVSSLAAKLGLPKPAISRVLDRLTGFDLVRRKVDPLDRGSILVQRTAAGMAFLSNIGTIMASEYARPGE
jgi:DNA-binding MarR family transcriptional regulator